MGDILKLTSPIPCSVNHYLKPRIMTVGGRPQISMYVTAEAKKYKKEFAAEVKRQVKLQGYDLEPNKTRHFYFDCDFYFDRIDKDTNNYFKLMLDTITDTGLIWLDDNVVAERVNRIMYDRDNPRIEITVRPVDYIGIFDTMKDYDDFLNSCHSCKRYKDGKCSILNKAVAGVVQSEITDYACSKHAVAKGEK